MDSSRLLNGLTWAVLALSLTITNVSGADEGVPVDAPIANEEPWDGSLAEYFEDGDSEPWITVRAGALALHKSDNQAHLLLADQATGRSLLSTTDTTPGWTAGAEIDFLLRLSDDVYFEFDWFTIGA